MLSFIQNMSPLSLLICLAVIVLLVGGKKIPDIARSLGRAKGEFKKGIEEGNRPDDEPKRLQ